jgi:hypothetical protein
MVDIESIDWDKHGDTDLNYGAVIGLLMRCSPRLKKLFPNIWDNEEGGKLSFDALVAILRDFSTALGKDDD